MFDLNKMLGNKKKIKKRSNDIFNMDKMIPKISNIKGLSLGISEKVKDQSMPKIPKNARVIINNNYYGNQRMPNQNYPSINEKRFLSTLESTDRNGMPVKMPKGFQDMDRDGIPARLDPDDYDPNNPRPMSTQKNNNKVNKIMRDMLGGD